MANITITIPDAFLPRVVEAMCVLNGLSTSNANAKSALINYLKQTTLSYERDKLCEADKTEREAKLVALSSVIDTNSDEVQAITIT